ncbi:SoxR reducing system RseC family protein [Vibrio sp. SS-MA-C1-2]|uniref:SoxR reducing system RseC family protein n=1 Tax=Vibrio sp. SS-MA-C1-2 TaxID=2908646 RepID=UPI001F4927E4|nr:SoxR reducing system RseC family protein [Vibrio sp. SS-MA-C1-2]UJF19034.1 SoxR reducing system RseC family protein [Vibrio sp. SS-MA-C1-2]
MATVINTYSNRIEVSCQQKTSCGSCASQNSCGTGIVSKVVSGRQHILQIETKQKVKIGDLVEIGLSERSMINSALLLYLVPLFSLILGTAIGQWLFVHLLGHGEGFVILLAALGLGVGLWFARLFARRQESLNHYKPQLIRIMGEPIELCSVTKTESDDSE